MNFLAHAFLSPPTDLILLGNFFGDSFKGKAENFGPQQVVDGIKLHRAIDHYTDTHPLVLEAIAVFKPQQKRMAAIVVDMVFDHLLAQAFSQWSTLSLEAFTEDIFLRLDNNSHFIPDLAHRFYPHMRKYNWLLAYREMEGLERAFIGMDRRFSGTSNMAKSTIIIQENREKLEQIFNQFFIELLNFVRLRT